MKTLAELKRELNIGNTITLIESPTMPNHKWLNVKRYVVKKQGNGVYLSPDKNDTKGSFLEFTNAKLTEYDGKEIRTYQPGHREFTEQEKHVLDNCPSKRPENKEIVEGDIMCDMSTSYYMDEKYYRDLGMDYLHYGRGTKRVDWSNTTIVDEQIKGNLELRYVLDI
jgi:hypothetical protein